MFVVSTTLKEPIPMVLDFVAWYRSQGAARIILHFDDPDDKAASLLQNVPWITCIRCTSGFWRDIGVDPAARFTLRQNSATLAAYASQENGWFLNVDADEFLFFWESNIADYLDNLPADVLSVRVLPAERLETPEYPNQAFFRTTGISRELAKKVYGDLGRPLHKRGGLIGHNDGKSVYRAGISNIVFRQHWAVHRKSRDKVDAEILGPKDGAFLLHVLDNGYERWRDKLAWRIGAWGFQRQVKGRLQTLMDGPEKDLREFYERIFVFRTDRLEEIRSEGNCIEVSFELERMRQELISDFDLKFQESSDLDGKNSGSLAAGL